MAKRLRSLSEHDSSEIINTPIKRPRQTTDSQNKNLPPQSFRGKGNSRRNIKYCTEKDSSKIQRLRRRSTRIRQPQEAKNPQNKNSSTQSLKPEIISGRNVKLYPEKDSLEIQRSRLRSRQPKQLQEAKTPQKKRSSTHSYECADDSRRNVKLRKEKDDLEIQKLKRQSTRIKQQQEAKNHQNKSSSTETFSSGDDSRDYIRAALLTLLSTAAATEDEVRDCDVLRIAVSIECVLYKKLGAYKPPRKLRDIPPRMKYKSILFKISNPENLDLGKKLLLG